MSLTEERATAALYGYEKWLPYCKALPKIELHAHLNGSIRDSTIRDLASRCSEPFADDAHKLTKRGDRSLAECFKLFDLIHKLTTNHEIITRIAREVVEDFAADNVIYLEIRTTPKSIPERQITKKSYIEAVLAGLRGGISSMSSRDCSSSTAVGHEDLLGMSSETKMDIQVQLLLSIDRRESADAAMETVRLADEYRDRGVAGVDLSGNPSVGNWGTFLPALLWAREHWLPVTLHCGEVPNAEEVRAMLAFKPERVGHVCCLEEAEWAALLTSNIPVEICLTSNIMTESVRSYSSHHFVDMYKVGHPTIICTDDCGVFSTYLSREYALAAAAFDLNKQDLKELALRSLEYVFATSSIKQQLHLKFQATAAAAAAGGDRALVGLSLEDMEALAARFGEQRYRGKQLHQFVYQNKGKELHDLKQLPAKFRQALAEAGWRVGRAPVHHVAAAADGTAKLLLRLEDNRMVEAVGIPMEFARGSKKLTACISSQVGCALRCSFCATGKGGFARNLQTYEIVDQVLALEELFQYRVSNVVFMGMGEPLMNMSAVLRAVHSINKDVGIGARMMTISTVGVPNTIKRLAQHNLQSTLAISLHAPTQQLREQIVPSAKVYPLEALLQDCRSYFQATGRRVSFEYTLLAGINDQREHANQLAELLRHWGLGQHVNVIPYNPVDDSEYRRPSRNAVMAFVDQLAQRKVTATIRHTRGLEANAACGQLRNQFQKTPYRTATEALSSPLRDDEALPLVV
eukprot:SM000024S07844  [mRNA]  locus=s24:792718:802523:- [translate_table: standard]